MCSIDEDTEEADMPLVGIGHLTMLDIAPPEWVSLAHDAGFNAVGIRAAAIGLTEEDWPMRAGSPNTGWRRSAGWMTPACECLTRSWCASTRRRSSRSTSRCSRRRPLWAPVSSTSWLTIPTCTDTFASLAEAARPYGVRPAIEAIPYMQVKTLSDAAVLVERCRRRSRHRSAPPAAQRRHTRRRAFAGS